jgi:hypothetical protein
MAVSLMAILVLGFSVWAHHMFVSGMAPWLRVPMMITTLLIAVPTGVKVFSWLATIWEGKLHLRTPMLWALGFVSMFLIGGLSGVMLGAVPIDIHVSDTYFIVAHIHYVLFGGSLFTIFAGIYYWFPKMTGRMYNEKLGKLHFWLTFVGFNATFFPMHWLGTDGMARRYSDYEPKYAALNMFISIASFGLGASTIVFLYNMITSLRSGPPAPGNPWRALTLEWQVTSPPPIFNFDEPPQIVGSPYAYGVPGARHAIVTVHAPPQPEEVPVPVALAVASREEREAIMSSLKHILVVANQTVSGDRLITAIRSRAATDPVRVTVICPQNDPTDAWVVDEAEVRAATQARLDGMLAALRRAGIQANGYVVERDPYTAVMDVVEEDPPSEIVVGTLPQTRSGWLRRDLVERLRDGTKLPVEHVVSDAPEMPRR